MSINAKKDRVPLSSIARTYGGHSMILYSVSCSFTSLWGLTHYEILKMPGVYSSIMSEMWSRRATLMSKSPAQ